METIFLVFLHQGAWEDHVALPVLSVRTEEEAKTAAAAIQSAAGEGYTSFREIPLFEKGGDIQQWVSSQSF
jgi:hypothetical protein